MQRGGGAWHTAAAPVRFALLGLGVALLVVATDILLALGSPTFRRLSAAKLSASGGSAWLVVALTAAVVAVVVPGTQVALLVMLRSARPARRRAGAVLALVCATGAVLQGAGAIMAMRLGLGMQRAPAGLLSLPLLALAVGAADLGAAITGWADRHDHAG